MKCDPPASTAEEWDPVFFCACDQLQGGDRLSKGTFIILLTIVFCLEMISSSNISQFQSHRKYFSECWFAVLRCSMTFEMYRKILAVMHKRILPHLDQPTMLIDFLTDSYNSGGVVSILALNGLFTLIVQHNL